MKVCHREGLRDAIAEMLTHEGAVILEVRVTPHEDCFSIIAPGHSNDDMLGLHRNDKPLIRRLCYPNP